MHLVVTMSESTPSSSPIPRNSEKQIMGESNEVGDEFSDLRHISIPDLPGCEDYNLETILDSVLDQSRDSSSLPSRNRDSRQPVVDDSS